MPCSDKSHTHKWPEEGVLVVEKCERFCAYCTGEDAEHEWKFAWFLRRHVRTVHLKRGEMANVVCSDGWSEKPFGMPKTTPRSKNKNKRVSRRVSPETPTPGPKRMRAQLLLKNAPNTPSPPISTKTRPQSSGRESGPKSVLKTPHTNKKRVSFSDASDERMIHTGESTAYKGPNNSPVLRAPVMANMVPLRPNSTPLHDAFRKAVKELRDQGLGGQIDHLSIAQIFYDEAHSMGLRRR